jgi:AcrR family transcriptional regulator
MQRHCIGYGTVCRVSDPVKRPYRSVLRTEQALATRRAVRAGAERLFLEQGYAATTMQEIAAAAGVGDRTVYAAFASKRALFDEVLGVATAGDEAPVAMRDRPEFAAILDDPDGAAVVAALAARTTSVMERAGRLLMVAVQSAGADPDMRRLDDDAAATMHRNMRAVARALAARGNLRDGVSVREAADVLRAILSPHLYDLLRVRSGWSAARYRTWIESRLREALLP